VSVLLAPLPYVGAIVMYWFTSASLFRDAEGVAPSNWNWRLVAPVMVGGLTPLALAAKSGLDGVQRGALLSATAAAIVFTLVGMGLLRDDKKFFRLQLALSEGDAKNPRALKWRILVIAGTLVLVYGAIVNVLVAAADLGSNPEPAAATPTRGAER
jgi:hypothetical protein